MNLEHIASYIRCRSAYELRWDSQLVPGANDALFDHYARAVDSAIANAVICEPKARQASANQFRDREDYPNSDPLTNEFTE